MIFRLVLPALAMLVSSVSAHAQTAFEPHTVAYVLCVSNATKKLALAIPEIAKDSIIERAFGACSSDEMAARKSLAKIGTGEAAINERISSTKQFIRLTAPDDIDRQRANRIPR
ncbi:MAG: hypothetical protein KF895_16380 [Parvibaculum sp.]|nr:hypothetical protein [Parvibaculum sp.]MBX3550627.1 hypothetical protein [Xanthobacteraceae bacterium]